MCPTSGHPAILRASRNPKKILDNPYTHMITSVMLPRQIPLPSLPSPPNQANAFISTLLQPLYSLFATSSLCFQQLAASFHKTPGWGVSAKKSRHSHFQAFPPSDAATPFLPIISLQTQQFHAVTHSFAQRQPNISIAFSPLRTLSIATGVAPPRPSGESRRRRVRGRCCLRRLWRRRRASGFGPGNTAGCRCRRSRRPCCA